MGNIYGKNGNVKKCIKGGNMSILKIFAVIVFYFIMLYTFRVLFTVALIKVIIKSKERAIKDFKEKAKESKGKERGKK